MVHYYYYFNYALVNSFIYFHYETMTLKLVVKNEIIDGKKYYIKQFYG